MYSKEDDKPVKYFTLWAVTVICFIGLTRPVNSTTSTVPQEPVAAPAVALIEKVPETISVSVALALPNVPLEDELIEAVITACDKYNVPMELALAVIETESGYQVAAVNKTCIGLFQINADYISAYEDALGITDIYDAKQNIECGVWYLGQLIEKHSEINLALMHYNLGNKASRLWNEGVHCTRYTDKVNAAFGRLKNGKG